MPITRQFLVLTAAVFAWLAYAMTITQAETVPPLAIDIARATAFVLSAVIAVRLLGLLLIELLIQGSWGITATSLVRLAVYLALGGIATALVLEYALNVDLATVLTTSALLTAILGLAMQSTLAGLFAGLAIQLEHRIRPGDVIRIDDRLATVETMGWRSLTARRSDQTLLIVPNPVIGHGTVAIRRPGAPVATEMTVTGPASLPPPIMAEIIEEAAAAIPGIATDLPIMVQLSAADPNSDAAEYRLRFFTRDNLLEEEALGPIVRVRLWYAFQRHGIAAAADPADRPDAAALPPKLRPDDPVSPLERILSALAASHAWGDADPEQRERLARDGVSLVYAPEEAIRLPRGLDRAAALVVSGEVRLRNDNATLPEWIEPAQTATARPDPMAGWDSSLLLAVERRLGAVIGPYARLAVRRAARQTSDLAELYRAVAPLIKDPAERAEFLRAAPQEAVRDFGPGTVLSLGRSMPGTRPPLIARRHVEILALPWAALPETAHPHTASTR